MAMNRFRDTKPRECAYCPPKPPARGPVRQLRHTKVFNITAKSQGECLMHAQNILRDEGDDLGYVLGFLEPLIVAISPPRQSEGDRDEWTMTLVVEI